MLKLCWTKMTLPPHPTPTPMRLYLLINIPSLPFLKELLDNNRPFARSGHMVRNKLHWDANYAVGLSKQRKVGLDWYEFLCFGSPTA